MRAVVKKRTQECDRIGRAWAGGVGTSDAGAGKSAPDRVGGKIVELEKFFGRAFPIVDVRFVPDFPHPSFYFGIAVTIAEVMHELEHKLGPFVVVLRRVRPTSEDRAVREGVAVRLGTSRKRFGHKTNFH